MLRLLQPTVAFLFVLLPAVAWGQPVSTIYDFAKTAWGIGTVRVGEPISHRDGKLLVYPATLKDRIGPDADRPANLMLVHEVGEGDSAQAGYRSEEEFFALIRWLPENSYWRDNLPNTPRHQVLGAPRYVFRGEDIVAVRERLKPFVDTLAMKGAARWKAEIAAVLAGLNCGDALFRDDAVLYLGRFKRLDVYFSQEHVAPLAAFLDSDAPAEKRAAVVSSVGANRLVLMVPKLEKIAESDSDIADVARQALSTIRTPTAPGAPPAAGA